jgi:putative ABC transport system permease protein
VLEAEAREELDALRSISEPGELGNLTLAAEDARAEWSFPRLERIARDVSMAVRTLRKNPGYSVACIAILALGIGANTAIFSVVNAVVLKPLPFPESGRLVFLWQKLSSLPDPFGPRLNATRLVYQEWKKLHEQFDAVEAFGVASLNEAGVARPRTVETAYSSSNLLGLAGARATMGRLFRADEEQKGMDRVVVLSDKYFDQRFHRDPAAIGKSITLGRDDYTVIGVLPPRFRVPATYEGEDQKKPEVWMPLSRLWNKAEDDTAMQLYVLARLRPGVPLDQARTALSARQDQLYKSDKERFPLWEASVFPVSQEDQSPDTSLALYALLGAVGALLLIGCANLANLTLARAAKRAREISIRRALGASRGRIIGQLLTESFLLSIAGAALGMVLAQLIVPALAAHVPRPQDVELNWIVFAFAAAVSLLTTFLFGLAPAISVSKVSVNEALKSRGGGGASALMARGRVVLTTVEVALAVVLLCASGVAIRSFTKLLQTGLGFRTEKLMTADISLPAAHYPDAASRGRFYATLLARARTIPGVATATVSTTLPMRALLISSFRIADVPKPPDKEIPVADIADVGSKYFPLMGLPILQGRDFTDSDFARNRGKGTGSVLVNRAFADKYFKSQNPLGKRLLLDNDRPYEIVGVAENFLAMGAVQQAHPQFFRARTDAENTLLLLRTAVPPESLSDEIRRAVLSVDPELPVTQLQSMDHIIDEAKSDPQFVLVLMSCFAALAWLLAMIGVYSVLSNLVAAQTREFGIRMALGATTGSVAWLVVRQSLKPVVSGLVLGLAGGVAVSRVMASLTDGFVPPDPLAFGVVAVAVLIVAPLAVWGPVLRAASVECTVALREE